MRRHVGFPRSTRQQPRSRAAIWTCNLAPCTERVGSLRRQSVDRFALSTSILMVDAEPLVVPTNEPGLHQIRDCATDTASTRSEHTAPHLGVDDCMRLSWVGRQSATAGEFVAHCGRRRAALGVALCHRNHGVGEPIPDGNTAIGIVHVGARPPRWSSRLSDQVEHHERVSRAV